MMEKQHELLRLVVQKMEIVAEAAQYDEGVDPTDTDVGGDGVRPQDVYF